MYLLVTFSIYSSVHSVKIITCRELFFSSFGEPGLNFTQILPIRNGCAVTLNKISRSNIKMIADGFWSCFVRSKNRLTFWVGQSRLESQGCLYIMNLLRVLVNVVVHGYHGYTILHRFFCVIISLCHINFM